MQNITKNHQTKKRSKNIAPRYYDINRYESLNQSGSIHHTKQRTGGVYNVYDGLSPIQGKQILEIRCGFGKNMQLFDSTNTFYRIDYSSDAVPVKDGWADIILLCDVIEHLEPFHYEKLLHEIKRILSNNGKVIVSTPIRDRIPFVFRRVYNKIVGLEEPYYWKSHINDLTLNTLLKSFESIGFKPIKTEISNNSQFIRLNVALNYFLGGGGNDLHGNICITNLKKVNL